MTIDPKEFRPITFQGVTFPATLMASDVLEPILGFEHKDIRRVAVAFDDLPRSHQESSV